MQFSRTGSEVHRIIKWKYSKPFGHHTALTTLLQSADRWNVCTNEGPFSHACKEKDRYPTNGSESLCSFSSITVPLYSISVPFVPGSLLLLTPAVWVLSETPLGEVGFYWLYFKKKKYFNTLSRPLNTHKYKYFCISSIWRMINWPELCKAFLQWHIFTQLLTSYLKSFCSSLR